jgi:hypothetical protein
MHQIRGIDMKQKLLLGLLVFLALGSLRAQEASAFTCGPNMATYSVSPLDNRSGAGVRCVLFANQNFSWYGEGNWNGATYRHVGQGLARGRIMIGYASDINGNGEIIHNNFPGNLSITTSGGTVPGQIYVRGAWNEIWNLDSNHYSNYQSPLPAVRTCGSFFTQYYVRDLAGSGRGYGVRCVMNNTPVPLSTWYGEGNWNGSTYAHLGMNNGGRYGASDICETSKYNICSHFPFGTLALTRVGAQINVTGAWSEAWLR